MIFRTIIAADDHEPAMSCACRLIGRVIRRSRRSAASAQTVMMKALLIPNGPPRYCTGGVGTMGIGAAGAGAVGGGTVG